MEAPSSEVILETVAGFYGYRLADLRSHDLNRHLTRASHVAMLLVRELTGDSYPRMGKLFDRDHTTIIYGCRRVQQMIRRDARLAAEVEDLRRALYEQVLLDPARQRGVTAEQVLEKTAGFFGLSAGQLLENSRTRATSRARQVAIYLAYELTDEFDYDLAVVFDRDRTSVMGARHKIGKLLKTDSQLAEQVERIKVQILQAGG